MGDVWMIAAILGSFVILVGFVVACDKIVGQDPPTMSAAPGTSGGGIAQSDSSRGDHLGEIEGATSGHHAVAGHNSAVSS